jgi:ketosteroid isomerase-like protein
MSEESTTPDLVELTQRSIDAVNAGDLDAAMSFFAPDIVWEMPETFGTYEGRVALLGLVQDWLDAYDEFQLAAEEIRDVGNGVTFSVVIQRGKPRGTTGWFHFRYGAVATWLDELVVRNTNYLDVDQARAAAERLAMERG